MRSGFKLLLGVLLVIGMVGTVQAGTLEKPCMYNLTSAERTQILNWFNSASEASIVSARLSATNVKRIRTQQTLGGYTSWNQMWLTYLGTNGNIKLVMIHLDMYQHPYDRRATRPPVRVRSEHRSRILNWLNSNPSLAQMEAIKLTMGTRLTKVPYWNSVGGFTSWKHLLAVISEGDIMKVGVHTGAARYVSGSTPVENISGIGTTTGNKLRAMGINSTQQLLYSCVWQDWRQELADKLGTYVYLGTVNWWARRADLNRISGIGEQYGEILEAVGVNTLPDLATKDPATLRNAMIAINAQRNLVQTMPSLTTVTSWVTRAASGRYPKMLEGDVRR